MWELITSSITSVSAATFVGVIGVCFYFNLHCSRFLVVSFVRVIALRLMNCAPPVRLITSYKSAFVCIIFHLLKQLQHSGLNIQTCMYVCRNQFVNKFNKENYQQTPCNCICVFFYTYIHMKVCHNIWYFCTFQINRQHA